MAALNQNRKDNMPCPSLVRAEMFAHLCSQTKTCGFQDPAPLFMPGLTLTNPWAEDCSEVGGPCSPSNACGPQPNFVCPEEAWRK